MMTGTTAQSSLLLVLAAFGAAVLGLNGYLLGVFYREITPRGGGGIEIPGHNGTVAPPDVLTSMSSSKLLNPSLQADRVRHSRHL